MSLLFFIVFWSSREGLKIKYSLHVPQVYCIGKGEAHKRYEFGARASIVGAVSHPENFPYSKTLVDVISQSTGLRGV